MLLQVETVGDCYIVAGGLIRKDDDGFSSVQTGVDPLNAVTVLEFAKVWQRLIENISVSLQCNKVVYVAK